MKYILVLILTLTTTSVWAGQEFQSPTLICYGYASGVSCVSKVSIEKDKLQIELLRLQIEEMKKSQAKEAKKTKK